MNKLFIVTTALVLTATAGFADGTRMTVAGPVLDVALINNVPETLNIASRVSPGDHQTHTVEVAGQTYAVFDSASTGGKVGDPIYAVRIN